MGSQLRLRYKIYRSALRFLIKQPQDRPDGRREYRARLLYLLYMAKKRKYNVDMPKCTSLTVANLPCPSLAQVVTLRGKQYKLKTCVMHAPDPIKRELGLLDTPGRGRKKKRTAAQIMRERFEAEADRYLKPLEEALTALKPVVVGNGASAHVEMHPDFAIQLKAANDIIDRIYGRAKQVSEITGADGEAIEIRVPNDEDRKAALAAVLATSGALGPVTASIPQNASAAAPNTN